MATPQPRVTVMTRQSCPPCHTMQAEVQRICAELGERWTAVDVDTDAGLRTAYGDRVPVLLVDGVELASWTLDEPRLRAAIAGDDR
ncbi:MAG: putative redoxin [Pseudonocardia sp.]|nr:putative redoxin [Pseudonocardia sp.]